VLINILVYYGIIKDVFNSDIDKEGDYKLLASRLQNFLICFEMFLAGKLCATLMNSPSRSLRFSSLFVALAHQYSFPYKPFQINDQPIDGHWFRTFLSMLDMEDVRQDLSEHFGVVGDRIGRSFRSQPTYLQYSEADFLIPQTPTSAQIVTVSRVKERSYGTYSNGPKNTPQAIGNNNKKYRVVEIEDKDSPHSSGQGSSRNTTNNSNMTHSTTSTTSSYGINVRGLENDPINYRNPDV
jgi:hypothetical protein